MAQYALKTSRPIFFWFPHKVKNGLLKGISGHNTSVSCWPWLWSLTLNLILPLCTSGYVTLRVPGFNTSHSCCLGKQCLQHGMPAWNELCLNPTQMQYSLWLHPALLPIPHCIASLFNISSLRSTWQVATYSKCGDWSAFPKNPDTNPNISLLKQRLSITTIMELMVPPPKKTSYIELYLEKAPSNK